MSPEMQTIQALQERLIKKEVRLGAEEDTSALAAASSKKKLENSGNPKTEIKKEPWSASIARKRGTLHEIAARRNAKKRTIQKRVIARLLSAVPAEERRRAALVT